MVHLKEAVAGYRNYLHASSEEPRYCFPFSLQRVFYLV